MPPTNTVAARQMGLRRALRKRERKSLPALSAELGVSVKALTVPISHLVRDGEAVRHTGRPPTYTKP